MILLCILGQADKNEGSYPPAPFAFQVICDKIDETEGVCL